MLYLPFLRFFCPFHFFNTFSLPTLIINYECNFCRCQKDEKWKKNKKNIIIKMGKEIITIFILCIIFIHFFFFCGSTWISKTFVRVKLKTTFIKIRCADPEYHKINVPEKVARKRIIVEKREKRENTKRKEYKENKKCCSALSHFICQQIL